MRIGFLAYEFPALSESFIRRYVQALTSLSHQVRVFVLREPPEGPAIPMPRGVAKDRVDVLAIQSFRPDILYASLSFRALSEAVSIGEQLRVPYVLQVWSGLDTFVHTLMFRQLFERVHSHLCKAIIVEDLFMAQWAVNRMGAPGHKLLLVPNSLDLSAFEGVVHQEREPLTLMTVARLIPKKGVVHLIEAVPKLPVGTQIQVVGDGPERPRLEALASKVGNGRVQFLGTLSEAELLGFYRTAAVYVAPCIRTSVGDADGVPTTVLEAMACGCPVVASDLMSMSQYVLPERTGILVTPGNREELAVAATWLLEDRATRHRLGQDARGFAFAHLDLRRNVLGIDEVLRL